MNFELSDEQRLLREAAIDALGRHDTLSAAREARDGGEPLDLWHVACQAGWSGLLAPTEHGGAGLGNFDAMLIAEQCGRRLAAAGLLAHLPASLVIADAADGGESAAAELLAELASGERRAALVLARPPAAGEDWTVDAIGSEGRRTGLPVLAGDGTVSGSAGYLPDASGAATLIVPVVDAAGAVAIVSVSAGAEGVELETVIRGDASRPLLNVRIDGVAADAIGAGVQALGRAWHLAQSLLAAEALGVCEATLEMAVAYAKDRHAFARPIGSFQAIKHQLVEMLRRAERLRSLCFYAGFAASSRPDEVALAASCARFAGEEGADYATRTNIAVHGGIGATWEHDAPLYWRRAALSRLLLGGESDAVDRVAGEIIAAAGAGVAAAA